MDQWQIMFAQLQSIVRSNQSLQQSLTQLVEFARHNPELCDEPDFWRSVQEYNFENDFAVLTSWAKQGFEAIEKGIDWQFLLLDLGDCPETFRLYKPGGQRLMSQQKFLSIVSDKLIISTLDLEYCFGSEVASPFSQLFGEDRSDLCDHSVNELSGSILDWTGNDEYDFHGNNGYLLWLTLTSLALLEPLRDKDFCNAILRGRTKLYLLSGFEEIFVSIATITHAGVSFEAI